MCVCVCLFVLAIIATPFNLALSNFGITFLIIRFSQIFEFFSELLPFSIFLSDFSITLKSSYAKTNGDRIEIRFAHK